MSVPMVKCMGLVAVACLCTWLVGRRRRWFRGVAFTPATAPLEGIIKYSQLYVNADGNTAIKQNCHFGALVKIGYSGTPQYVRTFASDFNVKTVVVTQQFGPNPWHYCPCTQFVITLSGQWYVETGDGTVTVMTPGDVVSILERDAMCVCLPRMGGLYRSCSLEPMTGPPPNRARSFSRTTRRIIRLHARVLSARSTIAVSYLGPGRAINSSFKSTASRTPASPVPGLGRELQSLARVQDTEAAPNA
mgnify:CR=1 FL=1|jgi:hypothetical protein